MDSRHKWMISKLEEGTGEASSQVFDSLSSNGGFAQISFLVTTGVPSLLQSEESGDNQPVFE